MAIPQLTEEQVATWTRRQKDEWWLKNVFRGNMPQLTLRSAVTGFLLGGVLSATNLYVGAKTGWTLGVGLTSVILAFAAFRVMSRVGFRDMTILENNASQSIATAAGYMTGPLISGMAAYMWIENKPLPMYQMFWFNVVLSILGVLVAFPMKRRFINDEQQPFPEGRACGVVLDTLYTSAAEVGIFKAKALAIAAAIAGFITFFTSASFFQFFVRLKLKFIDGVAWAEIVKSKEYVRQIKEAWHIPHNCDQLYDMLSKTKSIPTIGKANLQQLGVNPSLELAMFGAGGIMGVRAATSMLIGMVVNFFIIVPWMINIGEIVPDTGSFEAGNAKLGRSYILNTWALWWGIAMMVTAAMVALFAKPKVFIEAFNAVFRRAKNDATGSDPLRDIELPTWISWVGVPIVGAVGVWMAHDWFGVSWVFGATAIPMIIVLTLIAASSTALTGTTPTGSLSKIPQFIFGAADPKHPPTNLMTGVMCVEVASNASNLLMDIKPGYMLGGKPRHQAWGHIIGIIAGACASTPLFFLLFLKDYDPKLAEVDQKHVQNVMAPDGGPFGFPSALQWKGVSELIQKAFSQDEEKKADSPSVPANPDGSKTHAPPSDAPTTNPVSPASGGDAKPSSSPQSPSSVSPATDTAKPSTPATGAAQAVNPPPKKEILKTSIVVSMIIAAVVALVLEIVRIVRKGKLFISPLAVGLGVVVPPDSTLMMFCGAMFFLIMHAIYGKKKESFGHKLWVATQEPICAGIIAGAALVGITAAVVNALGLYGIK
ncbi:MAG: OPT/YSL family transporter [Phycisphaerales bacterium]|nr:OPT/YSL family transporter [Phycisphaerales bacterium]